MIKSKVLALVMSLFTVGGVTCGVVANNNSEVPKAPTQTVVENQAAVENTSSDVKGSVQIDKDNNTVTATPVNNNVGTQDNKNTSATNNAPSTVAPSKDNGSKDDGSKDKNSTKNENSVVGCPTDNVKGSACNDQNSCNTNNCGVVGAPSNCNNGACDNENTCGTTNCDSKGFTGVSPSDCTNNGLGNAGCNGNSKTIVIEAAPNSGSTQSCPLTSK